MAGVPGIGNVVASHYNNLEEKGVASRAESRIYHMRNLNNWIKSMLIGHYTEKIRSDAEANGEGRVPLRVLDVGAGKGGDFLKWQKARADHVVCADIAATSLEQAKVRHEDMRRRSRSGHLFSAEFVPADCTKKRLRDLYRDPDQKFDLVSCQFTFHYCFESLPQAECMLRNISENLRYGGFFIGTTPDAYDIVSRLEKSGENKIGNSVYSITRRWPEDAERIPLFGAQVDFHLEGVVDCPEFLVHFPTLEKLAAKYDLHLIERQRFGRYFERHRKNGADLLNRMKALETYPAVPHGVPLVGRDREEENYAHAKESVEGLRANDPQARVGTLSRDEWEAATLYTIFAFKKRKSC